MSIWTENIEHFRKGLQEGKPVTRRDLMVGTVGIAFGAAAVTVLGDNEGVQEELATTNAPQATPDNPHIIIKDEKRMKYEEAAIALRGKITSAIRASYLENHPELNTILSSIEVMDDEELRSQVVIENMDNKEEYEGFTDGVFKKTKYAVTNASGGGLILGYVDGDTHLMEAQLDDQRDLVPMSHNAKLSLTGLEIGRLIPTFFNTPITSERPWEYGNLNEWNIQYRVHEDSYDMVYNYTADSTGYVKLQSYRGFPIYRDTRVNRA